jgi:hypothetical protein
MHRASRYASDDRGRTVGAEFRNAARLANESLKQTNELRWRRLRFILMDSFAELGRKADDAPPSLSRLGR